MSKIKTCKNLPDLFEVFPPLLGNSGKNVVVSVLKMPTIRSFQRKANSAVFVL